MNTRAKRSGTVKVVETVKSIDRKGDDSVEELSERAKRSRNDNEKVSALRSPVEDTEMTRDRREDRGLDGDTSVNATAVTTLMMGIEPESEQIEGSNRETIFDSSNRTVHEEVEKNQNAATISTGTHVKVTKHITVEAPPLPRQDPYIENPLPGVADEVESYPCQFCSDRVFLTSFGLERHTKMSHPKELDRVLCEITVIQDEWRRREKERGKQRERLALAKIRQEALAAAAARQIGHKTKGGVVGDVSRSVEYLVSEERSDLHGEFFNRQDDDEYGMDAGGLSYDSCRICGLLINGDHPTAMENHMRAHRKNDQLRTQLIQEYGADFVSRVTCHECQLVFTDERKLIAHAESMHVRRRKYVCKWCGHVCLTMTELNCHKSDVHGMAISRSREADRGMERQRPGGGRVPPPLGMHSAGARRALAYQQAVNAQHGVSPKVLTSVEELPCRTTCDFCGLIMVKPSLLIRHMMRVHNRTNFTATVETKGMPSFKVNVDSGKLSWTCCNETYSDRSSFIYHRRSCHVPKFGTATDQSLASDYDGASEVQVQDDQYLLLLVNEDAETSQQKSCSEQQQIVLSADQLSQLGIEHGDNDNLVFYVNETSGEVQNVVSDRSGQEDDHTAEMQQNHYLLVRGDTDNSVLNANQIQQLFQSQVVDTE